MRRRTVLKAAVATAAGLAAMRYLGWPRAEGPLRVRRRGEAGPPTLLLHGLFASSACWLPLAEKLEADARLVMPDLVGFGSSPQPDAEYTADFHLRRLAPVVAEEPRWVVVAHSMGCFLAAELAVRQPEAVEALVLLNAPVYGSAESRRRLVIRQNGMTRLALSSPLAARVVCETMVCVPRVLMTRIAPWLRPDVPPEAASDYFRHTYVSYYRSFTHLVMGPMLLETLARVRPPVHVVQGAEDPVVEDAARLDWPDGVRVTSVEGADHTALLFRRPDVAASIIRDTLRGTRREGASVQ